MHIAVFGATGRTGRPLLDQSRQRDHDVVAFVRDATNLRTEIRDHHRIKIVEGDAYTGDGVDRAIAGDDSPVDAVVSVLGQTADGPDDLLTTAGRHMLEAMDTNDVNRFVTLVGAGVREDGESVSLSGRIMGSVLKLMARSVLEDARTHVEMVRGSDTNWTVVRAPRLTEAAHTGEFRHGTDLHLGMRDSAARANVAEFILDCLESDWYVHEMPKISDVSGQ